MTKEELRAYVNKQISNARTQKALDAMEEYAATHAREYQAAILQLTARYKKNERDNRLGVISPADYNLENNRINHAILETLDEMLEEGGGGGGEGGGGDLEARHYKILFLASNPEDTGRLRLDVELREISEGLRRSNHRDRFDLVPRLAVRPRDLTRAMLDESPNIVHFSGHGISAGDTEAESRALKWQGRKENLEEGLGIALEGNAGQTQIVGSDALGGMFELLEGEIDCVVLNNCYSHTQAEAIASHVPYVIGMKRAVNDKTAISFAVAFYDALSAGRDIPFAFKWAKNAIEMEGLSGEDIPVLLEKKENA